MSTPYVSSAAQAAPIASLEQRLDHLEAVEAIRTLKARYAALADAKYSSDYQRQSVDVMRTLAWQQALCFTEHALWEAGEGFGANRVGRDALYQWFQNSPWCFAVHYYGSPVITVAGNTAHATWRLWQIAMAQDTREAVLLAAVTDESYERQSDNSWLISRMRFEQLHMLPVGAGPAPLSATLAALASRHATDGSETETLESC